MSRDNATGAGFVGRRWADLRPAWDQRASQAKIPRHASAVGSQDARKKNESRPVRRANTPMHKESTSGNAASATHGASGSTSVVQNESRTEPVGTSPDSIPQAE